MDNCKIEKASLQDLDRILSIYAFARQFMKESGNPTQWGDDKPSPETLLEDIQKEQLYVIKEKETIHACFVFFIGEEPTYQVIKQGSWKDDSPYGVIHRVASDQQLHGVLNQIVSFALKSIRHLRIDTHADNKIMQHQILKNGFNYRGIISLGDGSLRMAFEKLG